MSPLNLKYGIYVHAQTVISRYHTAKRLFPPSGIFPQSGMLCIPLSGNIPLRGNAVYIFFVFSEQTGTFQ